MAIVFMISVLLSDFESTWFVDWQEYNSPIVRLQRQISVVFSWYFIID
jgi:hypothetical protein